MVRMILFSMVCLLPAVAQEQASDADPKLAKKLRLAEMVPLNVPIRDFRLPEVDEEGNLTSVLEAKAVRRVSASVFEMDDVKVQLFESGQPPRVLTTRRAKVYLEHDLVTGKDWVTVKRTDDGTTEVEGRGFVYHLKQKIWSVLSEGKTRFVLPESEKSDEITPPDAPSKSP